MSFKKYFLLMAIVIFQIPLHAEGDNLQADTDNPFGNGDFSIEMPDDVDNIERFPLDIEELEWRFRELKAQAGERQREQKSFEEEQGYLEEDYVKELIATAPQKIRDIIQAYKDSKKQSSREMREAFIKTALLLVGPPGNGKSDLSKAIAQEMGVPFVCVNSALVGNEYQNSAASNLARSIKRAHSIHPDFVVIIFEELQALTDKTHAKNNNQDAGFALGTLMDPFMKNKKMLFIANANDITNLPDQIKSRFRKAIVEIKLPDDEAKKRNLSFHLRKQLQNRSIDAKLIPLIAAKANDFSARDLKDLSDEILQVIARKFPEEISIHDCDLIIKEMQDARKKTELNRIEKVKRFISENKASVLNGAINLGLLTAHIILTIIDCQNTSKMDSLNRRIENLEKFWDLNKLKKISGVDPSNSKSFKGDSKNQ